MSIGTDLVVILRTFFHVLTLTTMLLVEGHHVSSKGE